MNISIGSRIILVLATVFFLAWTLLNTVFWPLEDYANITHAYAESTNQIVRGMSIGMAGYLSVVAIVIGWHATKNRQPNDSQLSCSKQ